MNKELIGEESGSVDSAVSKGRGFLEGAFVGGEGEDGVCLLRLFRRW